MEQPPYYSLEDLVSMIPEPNQSGCKRILEDNRELFNTVQGSSYNHQAWEGGYRDHVQEIMNITVVLYRTLNRLRPLSFELPDALLVTFLHDIEKPWKYEIGPDGNLKIKDELEDKTNQHEFRSQKLGEYGIILTPEQENGLEYIEGEILNHSNRQRYMGELAALCHLADVTSARLWWDHPLGKNDPWNGSKRFRK